MVFFIHIAMKSFLILFLFILNHTNAYPGDLGIRHESWIKSEKYYCPAENEQDIAHIEEASKEHYQLKYCLFEKEFQQSEEKVCKQEMNFVFDEMIGKDGGKCGSTSYQTKHAFSYYKCGGQSDLEKFRDENFRKYPVTKNFSRWYNYEICYDTVEKKVLWTMHYFQSLRLFRNPSYENQPELPAISKDPYFFMNPNLFSILETQYALEKNKNPSEYDSHIMVPQPLVPPDHYALRLTKKSTNHYINMAPLWENLVPLMKTIDLGIKQVQMKLESENPQSYDKLIILTKVEPSEDVDTTSKTWYNLLLFQGSIWYKFIYQEKKKAAVMIIINNTPGNPSFKGCIVGRKMKCEFEKWSKDKSSKLYYTAYARCCRITADDIMRVFSQNYEIGEYLNIHDLVTEN